MDTDQQPLFPADDFDDDSEVTEGAAPRQLVAPPPKLDEEPTQLRRVRLVHFKSFREFTLDLGRFNVIAGPNNAGKSTVLQAIDLLFSLIKVLADGNEFTKKSRFIPISMLPVAHIRDLFFGQARRVRNRPLEVEIGAEFTDGTAITIGIRYLYGVPNCRVLSSEGITSDKLAALLAKPAIWVPSSVGIVRDEEYRPAARRAGLIVAGRNNEVLRNLLLELNHNRPDAFARLQTTLKARFSADAHRVTFSELTDQFISATYSGDRGISHDLYSAGAGFIQVLQLLTYALSREASVLLLDEPDAHLHSNMQRVVVEVLEDLARQQNLQVLLSTHSKEIINFVDPSRLVLIEAGADGAGPAHDSVAVVAALRSVGDIDNVDAFELMKNRRALFTEGKEETTVLGRFAKTLGLQTFTGEGRVVPIPVGGATRFEHVQQLDVMEALLDRKIESLELRDRDALTDALRTAAMDEAKRPLWIWERDCLESYLVSTPVLARVIEERVREAGRGKVPTESEIEELVLELTDRLRDEAGDRVSNRYSDDMARRDKRPTIPEANELARNVISDSWQTVESRLKFVPGKRLLALMRQEIRERYEVSFGNERLAEAFEIGEIHPEVIKALNRVDKLR